MESKTTSSPLTRELTKTEAKIAIAQIEDRLFRLNKAQTEKQKFEDAERDRFNALNLDENSEEYKKADRDLCDRCFQNTQKLISKYDIPNGVYLFGRDETRDASIPISWWKKLISKWVNGKCTLEELEDMEWEAGEMDEFDHYWVFLEEASNYYARERRKEDDQLASKIETKWWSEIQTLKMLQIGFRNMKMPVKIEPESLMSMFYTGFVEGAERRKTRESSAAYWAEYDARKLTNAK